MSENEPVELEFIDELGLMLREELRSYLRHTKAKKSRLDAISVVHIALQLERANWVLEEIRDHLKGV